LSEEGDVESEIEDHSQHLELAFSLLNSLNMNREQKLKEERIIDQKILKMLRKELKSVNLETCRRDFKMMQLIKKKHIALKLIH
jgi:hypothetical protein